MLNDVIESYGGEKAVSYTHLDVYKRQERRWIHWMYIKIFLELEKDSFRRSMKIVEVLKQIPVSYTHLDVYKRQSKSNRLL